MPPPRNLLRAIAPRGPIARERSGAELAEVGLRSPARSARRACAAGDPELLHESRPNEHDRGQSCLARRANGHLRHHPHTTPAVPTAGVHHPTRDIRARVLRRNVHVKRQKYRVERLPIRPLRMRALKAELVRVSIPHRRARGRTRDGRCCSRRRTASTIRRPLGRVAQWESARFTRERSQVRNPPRPSARKPRSGRFLCASGTLPQSGRSPDGSARGSVARASGRLDSQNPTPRNP